jgi:hypothetical protein
LRGLRKKAILESKAQRAYDEDAARVMEIIDP